MKKIALLLFSTTALFAESITLDNQTAYPAKQSKMAVQWANSAREVDEDNKALMYEGKVNPGTLQSISQTGKIKLTLPKKAQQFRILVWSEGSEEPDYTTNWIDITAGKTYTLESDYLIPVVLMSGSGC
ncbi:MAG: hypothetical protein A3E80_02185 [Chlamydiae bacterium RIFCSPHIGHO2_12_FULL_49_9]|nr:MAG: hypothetical protein A3E80_02185 [Chlamydiae bacterium RIFCSPHIGHO2_12_FULL_49_9]